MVATSTARCFRAAGVMVTRFSSHSIPPTRTCPKPTNATVHTAMRIRYSSVSVATGRVNR